MDYTYDISQLNNTKLNSIKYTTIVLNILSSIIIKLV
jgi:hypothetical protein